MAGVWIHLSNLQSILVLPSYPPWLNQIKLVRLLKRKQGLFICDIALEGNK